MFSFFKTPLSVLLAVLFVFILQEGWAAERSRSETIVDLAQHPRGLSARLCELLMSEVFPFN